MLQRIRGARGLSIKEMREEGFTLIELLIVIVVLGVLAGIVVFGVSTFKSDSETAACKADVKTVSVAADAFMAKSATGAYPTNVQTDLVDKGYLKALPVTTVTLNAPVPASGSTPAVPGKASATCGGATYSV